MTSVAHPYTETDLRSLPAGVDVPTAAAILGIGRSAANEPIPCGDWPTPTLPLGKLIRIPTAPLLDLVKVTR